MNTTVWLEALFLGAMCLMLTWGWLTPQGPRLAPERGGRWVRSNLR